MQKVLIDPWGSELVGDYQRIIDDFGLEVFDKSLFPQPNRLMRRGVVFAGRDLQRIASCIKEKKPFYVLTGIMPSGEKIHFGTKAVIEQVKYFQERGAKTFVLVADLEAAATRGISLQEARKRALEFYIPAYIALGLDAKKTIFYFQSENHLVTNLGFTFAKKITFNEFKAIYGEAEPGKIMSAVTQCGDILFPQLEKPMPGIIPTGSDQDPHVRLCRDLVNRFKELKFVQISSIYHKFTPSLDGGLKMSKSKPESNLDLPEDVESVKRKLRKALTGGRDTLEEQRRLGAVIEKDMVFEMLKQHFVEDDKELEKIFQEYKSGKMLSGEIKELACKKAEAFMNAFNKDFEKAKKAVSKVKFFKA